MKAFVTMPKGDMGSDSSPLLDLKISAMGEEIIKECTHQDS